MTTILEELALVRVQGKEITIPSTERVLHIRPLDIAQILQEGKVPDILTPLVIKTVYSNVEDEEILGFLTTERKNVNEALAHIEAVDFVVQHSVVDQVQIKDLTWGEKRWIFRLALIPAEYLANFRYEEDADVADVSEGDEVREAAERDSED